MTYNPQYKQEYGAQDASPVILHAKDDVNSNRAFPILRGAFNPGFQIPAYDRIQLSYTGGDLTGVVYSSSGNTIGVLGLTYSSGLLSEVIRLS